MLFCLVAAAGSGLLALIPFGALQTSMHYADATAPLQMAGLAAPAFNSPLNGMMKIGLMFDHGNSVGAAFVLFVLGLGLNVGVVAWLAAVYGWRRTAVWLGTTVAATVVLGYALQLGLPKPARAEEHTHAFDEFSNPFPSSTDVMPDAARQKVMQRAEGPELLALPALAGFVLLGLLDRAARRRWDVDGWLARRPDRPTGVGRYDVTIPGPVLGVVAIAGLVVFSVAGAYTYYPPPDQALADLHRLRADVAAALAGARAARPDDAPRRRAEAVRELEQTDLAVRKLMVGVYIRAYRLTPEQTATADELREHLEHVRDELLAGRADEAYTMRAELDAAFRACRAAYGAE